MTEIFLKCDVTYSWTPLCHKVSHFLGPPSPLERDVLYGRPHRMKARTDVHRALIFLFAFNLPAATVNCEYLCVMSLKLFLIPLLTGSHPPTSWSTSYL